MDADLNSVTQCARKLIPCRRKTKDARNSRDPLPSMTLSLPQVKETDLSASLGEGRWLELECIQYLDNKGVKRTWERCIRKHNTRTQSRSADGRRNDSDGRAPVSHDSLSFLY